MGCVLLAKEAESSTNHIRVTRSSTTIEAADRLIMPWKKATFSSQDYSLAMLLPVALHVMAFLWI